ncbi:MAG: hypothetical protein ABJQ71_13660 [Roseibium sp.]
MIGSLTPLAALNGMAIGISISESDQLSSFGIDKHTVNLAVRELAMAIIGQGGRVVFGHDWRENGVMVDIFEFAISHRGVGSERSRSDRPPISNYVAWPCKTSIDDDSQKRFAEVIAVHEVKPPLAPNHAMLSETNRQVWSARSLSHMRLAMTQACDARICLGGKVAGYSGCAAGIVEEAYLALQHGQPLFISSIFGGASAEFIRQLEGEPLEQEGVFGPDAETQAPVIDALTSDDTQLNTQSVTKWGLRRLSQTNYLTFEENRKLFAATQIQEVVGWMLLGLGRAQSRRVQ